MELLIFLGDECPISQNYSHKLNDLFNKYGDQIEFKGIISVQGVTNEEVANYKSKYNINFDLIADPDLTFVNLFNATATPEVFLLAGDEIFYSGAIDNWYYELGSTRSVITENYLEEAIIAVLANKQIKITRTTPIGCKISMKVYEMDHH